MEKYICIGVMAAIFLIFDQCKPSTADLGEFCNGKDDGNYANPENPKKYITCIMGYVIYKECPDEKQRFNEESNSCVEVVKTTPIPATPPMPKKPTVPEPPLPVPPLPPIPPITKPKQPTPPLPQKPKTNNKCGKNKKTFSTQGGGEAFPFTWIWQGAIYYKGKFICGGALISSNLLLTAASCVRKGNYNRDPQAIVVRLGDHVRETNEGSEQEIDVEKITPHGTNDIAVIKLKTDAKLNKKVGIVCLPEENSILPKDSVCYTTGWGKESESESSNNFLEEARTSKTSNVNCVINDPGLSKKKTDSVLCGKFTDADDPTCYGDVGGPFVCKSEKGKWVLEGIRIRKVNKCNENVHYTAFTEVKKCISWIKKF